MESAMTVNQVSICLNVDAKTVYRMVNRGDLPGFKVGGTWRFQREDIDLWIATKKKAAKVQAGRTR